MNSDQLSKLGIESKWLKPLQDTFAKYEINTPQRKAAFIGQCAHESNNFRSLEENLHYSANGLMRTWPSRFPDFDVAEKYANNPEKIANKVYAGRLGNYNDGDGWKYHGRGLIQLTGRDNYKSCGEALGQPLLDKPEIVLQPEYAVMSAGWFWNRKQLNALADASDFDTMTKRINGGLIGLDDRKAKIAKALTVLG
jgi:putative chitinase